MRVVVGLSVAVVAILSSGCPQTGPEASGTTYHKDIAPLVMNNCASCHQEGGIAPFPLLTYDDVVANKDSIAFSVSNRLMPPWTLDNTGACQTFENARWLSDDEIALFVDWINDGAVEGEKPGQALTPPAPDALEDDNAIYVEMQEPYLPAPQPGNPTDDYRCFFLDPGLDADAYVTGFEIVPGQAQEVHHMLLFALLEDGTEADAQALDDEDPAPGWTCFGAAGDGVSQDEILLVAGWAPGTNVMRYPENTGVYVPGRRRMVMQIHYNLLAGEPVADLTGLKIAFAPSVANDALLLPVADDGFELPPNQPVVDYKSTTSLFGLPEPLLVHGIFPHMHVMGQQLKIEKRPIGETGDDNVECLGDVQHWDFHWQQLAFYDEPVVVDGGNQLDLKCTWDTTGRTENTYWGEGTTDEMCLVFAYVTRAQGGSVIDLLDSL